MGGTSANNTKIARHVFHFLEIASINLQHAKAMRLRMYKFTELPCAVVRSRKQGGKLNKTLAWAGQQCRAFDQGMHA